MAPTELGRVETEPIRSILDGTVIAARAPRVDPRLLCGRDSGRRANSPAGSAVPITATTATAMDEFARAVRGMSKLLKEFEPTGGYGWTFNLGCWPPRSRTGGDGRKTIGHQRR